MSDVTDLMASVLRLLGERDAVSETGDPVLCGTDIPLVRGGRITAPHTLLDVGTS